MALRSAAAAAPRSLRRLITGTSARTLPIFLQAIHDCEKPTPPNTNAFVSGRLFSSASTSSFIPPPLPPSAQQREQPEPSTNLFVSGNSFFLNLVDFRLFALKTINLSRLCVLLIVPFLVVTLLMILCFMVSFPLNFYLSGVGGEFHF